MTYLKQIRATVMAGTRASARVEEDGLTIVDAYAEG